MEQDHKNLQVIFSDSLVGNFCWYLPWYFSYCLLATMPILKHLERRQALQPVRVRLLHFLFNRAVPLHTGGSRPSAVIIHFFFFCAVRNSLINGLNVSRRTAFPSQAFAAPFFRSIHTLRQSLDFSRDQDIFQAVFVLLFFLLPGNILAKYILVLGPKICTGHRTPCRRRHANNGTHIVANECSHSWQATSASAFCVNWALGWATIYPPVTALTVQRPKKLWHLLQAQTPRA